MAGETIRCAAVCLSITPWSRTSHIVHWLTPQGKVATVVKGAVRPKSQFLGQYDLNYTCDIVYYARAHGELHALRECVPVAFREGLRGNYRALAVAGYFRRLVAELAPAGGEGAAWLTLLEEALDRLSTCASAVAVPLVEQLVQFELKVLGLSGLAPDFSGYDSAAAWSAFALESGSFDSSADGRRIRIAREVAAYLENPGRSPENPRVPLDAAWVVGVLYQFHLDHVSDARRTVLGMI